MTNREEDVPSLRTVPVLGQPLAVLDYAGAVEIVRAWARRGDRAYAVEAANAHVVTLARHDRAFGRSMARFDLILPDGMPLVWSINRQLPPETPLRDRVYGPTFMLRCLEAAAGPGETHFLLGGTPELLAALQEKFTARLPRAAVAGVYSPPFGGWPPGEDERIFARIAESGARFVWVGLGCPKQEHWISANLSRLPAGVYFGIGAAFAFHAGRVTTEPRRLLKRYAVYNTLFLFYSVFDRFQSRKTR